MSPRRRFIAAIYGGRKDRPSIGTVTSLANTEAMDLCGAFFPEAHFDPRTMAKLAALVSLEAGFDMLFPVFSVVHEAAALGAPIDWGQKDIMPSILAPLWEEPEDIHIPENFEEKSSMAAVLQALRSLKEGYGDKYAIVGKVFGPWSLGFHLFGVEQILVLTVEDPEKLKKVFAALLEVTVKSAVAQVKAGADVLCLGDHCSRDMCSPETYRRFLFPLHQVLSQRIPCPVALHTCGDTSDRIPFFAETTFDCFHFDTRVPTETAVALAGGKISLMGGVNNVASLLSGDEDRILADVKVAINAAVDVIGPECAIPLNTKMRSLKAIRKAVEKVIQR